MFYWFQSGDLDSVKRIVESNTVSINASDVNKTTALHIASKSGNSKVVEFLIENGADMRLKDYKGRNVLEVAIEKHGYAFSSIRTTFSVD